MNNKNRTPGLWKLQTLETNHNGYEWPTFAVRSMATNHCLAIVGDVDRATADHNKGNARLISAAPELLEACNVALKNLTPLYSTDHLVIKTLKSAIAKANGH